MEKIKSFLDSDQGKDILVVIIIILVGLGSFKLGRMSQNSPKEGLKIEYSDQGANAIESLNLSNNSNNLEKLNSGSGNFFASNRGSKYYSISCNAGKTIKEENRIYFKTSGEAQQAGYELSSSCK